MFHLKKIMGAVCLLTCCYSNEGNSAESIIAGMLSSTKDIVTQMAQETVKEVIQPRVQDFIGAAKDKTEQLVAQTPSVIGSLVGAGIKTLDILKTMGQNGAVKATSIFDALKGENTEKLAIIANDKKLVEYIADIVSGTSDKIEKESAMACLALFEKVLGNAPQVVQTGYKYIKGLVKVIKYVNGKITDVKSGLWQRGTDHYNIAHIAVRMRSSRMMYWALVNCKPIIFEQINLAGQTPYRLALIMREGAATRGISLLCCINTAFQGCITDKITKQKEQLGAIIRMLELVRNGNRIEDVVEQQEEIGQQDTVSSIKTDTVEVAPVVPPVVEKKLVEAVQQPTVVVQEDPEAENSYDDDDVQDIDDDLLALFQI